MQYEMVFKVKYVNGSKKSSKIVSSFYIIQNRF